MRTFTFLYFLSSFIYLSFGAYTLGLNQSSRINRSFFLQCLALGQWSFFYGLMTIAATSSMALFWFYLAMIGCCFFYGASLHFILALTKRDVKRWLFYVIYFPGLFFLFFILTPFGGITEADFILTKYGFANLPPSHTIWFWGFVLYYLSYIGLDLYFVRQWREESCDPRIKRQGEIIFFAIIIALVISTSIDILLPALNIIVPQTGILVILIWIIGIWYAIAKCSLMKLTFDFTIRDILKNMNDSVLLLNKEGIIKEANSRLLCALGYGEEDLQESHVERILVEKGFMDLIEKRQGEMRAEQGEWTLKGKNGQKRPALFSVTALQDGQILIGYLCIFLDISQQKESERRIIEQKEYFEALFKHSTDSIILYDDTSSILQVNQRFTQLFHYPLEEIEGRPLASIPLLKEDQAMIKKVLSGEQIFHVTSRLTSQGQLLHLIIKGIPIFIDGEIKGGYGIYVDITEEKSKEQRLKYISLHDTLTDLYNREHFEIMMKKAEGENLYPITLIIVDMDNLKFVNDTLGHKVGDELIQRVAKILKQSVRAQDIVARIGGDEFAILLVETNRNMASIIMERAKQAIKEQHLRGELPFSISMGSSTAEKNERSLEEIFKEADQNMYREKTSKRETKKESLIHVLLKNLHFKDFLGDGHGERIALLSRRLGQEIGLHKKELERLLLLSFFHDLGIAFLPQEILLKEDVLSIKERREAQQHPETGYRMALAIEPLQEIAPFILHHHEKWNGEGYPHGQKQEEIPIECRIFSLVDAFDIMTHRGLYWPVLEKDKAINELKKEAGGQFDPHLVPLFISIIKR